MTHRRGAVAANQHAQVGPALSARCEDRNHRGGFNDLLLEGRDRSLLPGTPGDIEDEFAL